MPSLDLIPLWALNDKYSEMTGQPGPGYQVFHTAVLKGQLPAVRKGARIFVHPDDATAYFGKVSASEHVAA